MNRNLRNVVALVVGVALGAAFTYASAASVAVKPPVGITGNPAASSGWTSASNFVGSFSSASFSGSFSTNVGGRSVTMPASMRMAANAGQFAAAAVRSSPAALIGSAVVSWLMANGMEYLDGQFQKKGVVDPVSGGWDWVCTKGGVPVTGDPAAIAIQCAASAGWGTVTFHHWQDNGPNSKVYYAYSSAFGGGPWGVATLTKTANCQAGYYLSGGSCVPQPKPATAADWLPLETAPLPDPVATELAKKGVAIPLEDPIFNPRYVDQPISDPYVDPVTGKRYQDSARVTPDSKGQTADVQVSKQPVDEEGQPEQDPETGADMKPEEVTNPCRANPDASGCKSLDDVPDSELPKKENPFSLNPVSGFGADTAACPAPQTLFTKGGQVVTWDWINFCKFAQGIRPLLIGFAWLAAIAMVVAVGRRNT